MLKQVMTAPGEIEFVDAATPVPGPGEALVKIMKIGICGSDIHVYHGKHPFTKYPVTQGHEVSGEIAALGADVLGLRLGQKVTIEPQLVCGECYPCRHGKYNLCESLRVMGFQAPGAAARYFCVDAAKVTPLPDEMSFDEGALIEPLAVAAHAARRAGDIAGKNVAVIGAGPIGNLVMQAAKGMGAAKALISDVSAMRLELAKACGADYTANAREIELGEAMVEAFGPDKADIIYDCAGNNASIGQAIKHARKGSTIILVAVFADVGAADFAVLNDHELDLNTSMMYRHEDYVKAIELAVAGKVSLAPLMSKTFAFRDYLEAYRYIDLNRETTMKVLIDIQRD